MTLRSVGFCCFLARLRLPMQELPRKLVRELVRELARVLVRGSCAGILCGGLLWRVRFAGGLVREPALPPGAACASSQAPAFGYPHGGLGNRTRCCWGWVSAHAHPHHSPSPRYTAFVIELRTHGGVVWTVERRFSQFHMLNESLKKRFEELRLFKFPPKRWFSSFATATVEQRRRVFEVFLRELLGLQPRPQEMNAFLDINAHVWGGAASGGLLDSVAAAVAATTGDASAVATAAGSRSGSVTVAPRAGAGGAPGEAQADFVARLGAGRIGLDDFELLRVLGKGSFGKVFLVRLLATGQVYAMKVRRGGGRVLGSVCGKTLGLCPQHLVVSSGALTPRGHFDCWVFASRTHPLRRWSASSGASATVQSHWDICERVSNFTMSLCATLRRFSRSPMSCAAARLSTRVPSGVSWEASTTRLLLLCALLSRCVGASVAVMKWCWQGRRELVALGHCRPPRLPSCTT